MASTAQFLGPGAGGEPVKLDASLVVTFEVGYLRYENILSKIIPLEVAFFFLFYRVSKPLCVHTV